MLYLNSIFFKRWPFLILVNLGGPSEQFATLRWEVAQHSFITVCHQVTARLFYGRWEIFRIQQMEVRQYHVSGHNLGGRFPHKIGLKNRPYIGQAPSIQIPEIPIDSSEMVFKNILNFITQKTARVIDATPSYEYVLFKDGIQVYSVVHVYVYI